MRVSTIEADVAGESTDAVFLIGRFDTVSRVSDAAKFARRDGF